MTDDSQEPIEYELLHTATLAEFERDVLRERTRAGVAAARDRGARFGRPRALSAQQVEMARTLLANPNLSAR